MKLNILLLDNFRGVKIIENNIPMNIAVIETAIVIKNAANNSSPQPFEPK